MCDEIIESNKGGRNFNESKPVKLKPSIFYLNFISYYSIIDSYWLLLLPDKISSKRKTGINI